MQSNTISVRSLKKKIETLENTIENFKRYDQNRKEYYKDAMIRLGQLESFMEEIEEKDKLVLKLKRYKEIICIYERKQFLSKIENLTDEEIVSTYNKVAYEEELKSLKQRNKELKELNDRLISKICQLQKDGNKLWQFEMKKN